jgi:ketosteroid isomerase-like protein
MKTRIAVLFVLIGFACVLRNAHVTAKSSSDESREVIRALEAARNEAIVHGDSTALGKMTSADYTFITLRGELRTKADIVRGFATGAFKYEAREISDLDIRVYGDAAVVTGRSSQKGTENGKDYSGDYRFTRVYIKQDGRWLTVALQATRVEG